MWRTTSSWTPGARDLSFRRRAIIIRITEDILVNRRIMVADIALSVRRVQNRWLVPPRHDIRLVPPSVRQVVEGLVAAVVAAVADDGEICP